MRYIPYQELDPHIKNKLNNILIDKVKESKESIFWLCGWSKNAVNISKGQKANEVVNVEYANVLDIPIIQRQGGGGAVYLRAKSDIAWHLIAPKDFFPKSLQEKYKYVCEKLIKTLRELGIQSYYKPLNDVRTNKGKISGSTLKISDDVIYLGGTLIYDCDKAMMNKLLRPEKDSFKKDVPERMKHVCGITSFKNIPVEKVLTALENNFLSKDYKKEGLTKEELEHARKD